MITMLVTPFVLIWIGIKINMPGYYYLVLALPLLADAIITGYRAGKDD